MVAPSESTLQKYYPFNVRTPLQGSELSVVKQWQKDVSIDLTVAMYNTVRDFNFASVVRNACAFGLKRVYIIGFKKYDKRGAVGTQHLMDVVHYKDFDTFVEDVGATNIVPIEHPDQYSLDNTPIRVSEYPFKSGQCLLLGEEGAGIPSGHLEKFSNYCYIPQVGAVRSLNAAVAAGIVMHQAATCLEKQREKAIS